MALDYPWFRLVFVSKTERKFDQLYVTAHATATHVCFLFTANVTYVSEHVL